LREGIDVLVLDGRILIVMYVNCVSGSY